jgi:ABC-type amino acid transport system permease subunit
MGNFAPFLGEDDPITIGADTLPAYATSMAYGQSYELGYLSGLSIRTLVLIAAIVIGAVIIIKEI